MSVGYPIAAEKAYDARVSCGLGSPELVSEQDTGYLKAVRYINYVNTSWNHPTQAAI
jgi:hypothetical protein